MGRTMTMFLYGQYDSPFVRRVAVTMNIYGMPFERKVLSVIADQERLRRVNPLGKVPALELDGGEVLFDSQMILEHLDETAGPEMALTPPGGDRRREILRLTAIGLGAADKAVALSFEIRYRNPDTIDPRYVERLESQVGSALAWLEAHKLSPWLAGNALTQADVTAACTVTYLRNKHPHLFQDGAYPRLTTLTAAAESLDAFKASPFLIG